jgi:pimeloyl-ACP methyl ester carboxylesterase
VKMSKPASTKKRPVKPQGVASSARRKGSVAPSRTTSAPPTVSARWLLSAVVIAVVAALVCAWGTLCVLFWQGSWQLLYHPKAAVDRTPASVSLPFDGVGFATSASGEPQLRGWWIPSATEGRFTAIYLHGADGNLGDVVDAFTPLHAAGMNILAFDYRGYGQSRFQHPSEARMREDVESAIEYLTGTRHIPARWLVMVGRDLGANLALEVGAAHPELAGVVLESPLESPLTSTFNDPRAHLVPAHALIRDRWELNAPAAQLRIPSLWFYWTTAKPLDQSDDYPDAYSQVVARKVLVWIKGSSEADKEYFNALSVWLDDLSTMNKNP